MCRLNIFVIVIIIIIIIMIVIIIIIIIIINIIITCPGPLSFFSSLFPFILLVADHSRYEEFLRQMRRKKKKRLVY